MLRAELGQFSDEDGKSIFDHRAAILELIRILASSRIVFVNMPDWFSRVPIPYLAHGAGDSPVIAHASPDGTIYLSYRLFDTLYKDAMKELQGVVSGQDDEMLSVAEVLGERKPHAWARYRLCLAYLLHAAASSPRAANLHALNRGSVGRLIAGPSQSGAYPDRLRQAVDECIEDVVIRSVMPVRDSLLQGYLREDLTDEASTFVSRIADACLADPGRIDDLLETLSLCDVTDLFADALADAERGVHGEAHDLPRKAAALLDACEEKVLWPDGDAPDDPVEMAALYGLFPSERVFARVLRILDAMADADGVALFMNALSSCQPNYRDHFVRLLRQHAADSVAEQGSWRRELRPAARRVEKAVAAAVADEALRAGPDSESVAEALCVYPELSVLEQLACRLPDDTLLPEHIQYGLIRANRDLDGYLLEQLDDLDEDLGARIAPATIRAYQWLLVDRIYGIVNAIGRYTTRADMEDLSARLGRFAACCRALSTPSDGRDLFAEVERDLVEIASCSAPIVRLLLEDSIQAVRFYLAESLCLVGEKERSLPPVLAASSLLGGIEHAGFFLPEGRVKKTTLKARWLADKMTAAGPEGANLPYSARERSVCALELARHYRTRGEPYRDGCMVYVQRALAFWPENPEAQALQEALREEDENEISDHDALSEVLSGDGGRSFFRQVLISPPVLATAAVIAALVGIIAWHWPEIVSFVKGMVGMAGLAGLGMLSFSATADETEESPVEPQPVGVPAAGAFSGRALAQEIAHIYHDVQSAFAGSIGHATKGDRSPVTIADYLVQIYATLAVRERFPEDGIIGEEEIDVDELERRLADPALAKLAEKYRPLIDAYRRMPPVPTPAPGARLARYWIMDPLDGTRSFVTGSGRFAFSLGRLIWNENTQLYEAEYAIAYAPQYETHYGHDVIWGPLVECDRTIGSVALWETMHDGTLTRVADNLRFDRTDEDMMADGSPWQVILRDPTTSATGPNRFRTEFAARYGDEHITGTWESSVVGMMEVLLGNCAVYHSEMHLWDHAAMAGMVTAAGGVVYREISRAPIAGYTAHDIESAQRGDWFPVIATRGGSHTLPVERRMDDVIHVSEEELKRFVREGNVKRGEPGRHTAANVAYMFDLAMEEAGVQFRSVLGGDAVSVHKAYDPACVHSYSIPSLTLIYLGDKEKVYDGYLLLLNDRNEVVGYGSSTRTYDMAQFRYQIFEPFRGKGGHYGTKALHLILYALYREDRGYGTEEFVFYDYAEKEPYDPDRVMRRLLTRYGFHEERKTYFSDFVLPMDGPVPPSPLLEELFGKAEPAIAPEGEKPEVSPETEKTHMKALADEIALAKGPVILAVGRGVLPGFRGESPFNNELKELLDKVGSLCRERGGRLVIADETKLLDNDEELKTAIAEVKSVTGQDPVVITLADIDHAAFDMLYEDYTGEGEKTIDRLIGVNATHISADDYIAIVEMLARTLRVARLPSVSFASSLTVAVDSDSRYPRITVFIPQALPFPPDEKERIIRSFYTAQQHA